MKALLLVDCSWNDLLKHPGLRGAAKDGCRGQQNNVQLMLMHCAVTTPPEHK